MTTNRSPTHFSQTAGISAWEDEGGAIRPGHTARSPTTGDGPMLMALGAAVVARWSTLSRDSRKALFAAAVGGRQTNGRLARYLRTHRHNGA
jgi:hypothetical protein